MTRPSKKKLHSKNQVKKQERNSSGTFSTKKIKATEADDINQEDDVEQIELDNSFSDDQVEWGNDDDSDWEEDDMEEKNIYENLINKPLELKWTDDASLEKQKRGMYMKGRIPKSTYYDKYGPSGTFTKAAEGSQKITDFFQSEKSESSNNLLGDWEEVMGDDDYDEDDNTGNEWREKNMSEKIEFLKNELINSKDNMSFSEYNKKRAIFEYLKRLNNGKGKINSSLEAAQIVFINPPSGKSRTIRYWASYWLSNKSIPISKQGKHKKFIRLIDDEDIAEKCHLWIRSQGGTTTPTKFKEFIEQNLLLDTGIMEKKSVSINTASRWLNVLGYTFKQNRQDIYYDGHERPDVVKYRKKFLEEIFNYEKYMTTFDDETLEPIPPILSPDKKEIVLVTHDECIFYSNDGKRGVWVRDGELPLKKKGNWRCIMVEE